MDLSHSVDDVVQRNLIGFKNVDVIQCSIDSPPLLNQSIDIVYCHNVIQHTPSVEKTAHALYALTAPGGEFVFNCYPLNDSGVMRWVRFHMIYRPLRMMLSRMPFSIIMIYARLMALFRLIPIVGIVLEKLGFCVMGDVPRVPAETKWGYLKRCFKSCSLNTFDGFGSHTFQHHKSDDEIRALVHEMQPNPAKVANMEKYFLRPAPVGCALRVSR
jgi:SAM-dependent methyltransferase